MGFMFGGDLEGGAATDEAASSRGYGLGDAGLAAGMDMMGMNGAEVESPRKDGGFSRETTDKIVKNMRDSGQYGGDAGISDELERMGYDYQQRAEQVGMIDGLTGWGRKLANGLIDVAGTYAFGPAYAMAVPAIRAGVDYHQAVSTGAEVDPSHFKKAAGNAVVGLLTATPAFKSMQMEAFLGGHSLLGGGTAGMIGGSVAASGLKKLAGMAGETVATADWQGRSAAPARETGKEAADPVGRQPMTVAEKMNQIRKFDLSMKGWGRIV